MAVKWYGAKILAEVHAKAEAKMSIGAQMIATHAKNSMREPKHGKPGPQTQRSAPGEPPAAQHGGAGLQGDITWEKPMPLVRRVGTNMKVGLWMELGTRAHFIRRRKAKALHFVGAGGEDVFVRNVHHPGTLPRPFLRPAMDACRDRIRALFGRP